MPLHISEIAKSITPSATLGLNATVAQLKSEGVDVISLGAGEPDFDTPAHIRKAAKEAIDSGKTRYTDVSGIPALRQAVADHIYAHKHLRYTPEEIIVSSGAKQALVLALQAILDPGDEVILPSPYWISYPEMIKIAGGKAITLKTGPETEFLPTPAQIENAVTERTRAIIINSPNNPTGTIWPRELLAAAAETARKHDLFLISDEIYEDLCYDGYSHISPAQISDDAKQRTILVSGFSKAYAMTGWRMGYASGPRFVIKAMVALQSHATGNPNSITQYAALTALTASQDCVIDMAHSFARRRTLLLFLLAQNGLKPGAMPKGAFYMLLDVRHYLGKKCGDEVIETDADFSRLLLENNYVAVIPGAPFGASGFVRLSYAVSDVQITEAVRRISAFVQSLT
ncbi:MAG: pyridoxal phosphate-dependent aminotransferase [Clostridia bacterium]|nr:pyridoxal phosphate-dependent aminotransferase [Clostridia bacterium]